MNRVMMGISTFASVSGGQLLLNCYRTLECSRVHLYSQFAKKGEFWSAAPTAPDPITNHALKTIHLFCHWIGHAIGVKLISTYYHMKRFPLMLLLPIFNQRIRNSCIVKDSIIAASYWPRYHWLWLNWKMQIMVSNRSVKCVTLTTISWHQVASYRIHLCRARRSSHRPSIYIENWHSNGLQHYFE
jgi:hypothetical protein